MSKSKGNVVTPMHLLEEYGADAARYWAARGRPGADTAFDPQQMKVGRRLAVKLLNASKFALADLPEQGDALTHPLDRAMVARLAAVVTEATGGFEGYDYTRALERTEEFFWWYCDQYMELVKGRRYEQDTEASASVSRALRIALSVFQRLLAPFLPFVCEEVWSWWQEGSVHLAAWPDAGELAGERDGDPDECRREDIGTRCHGGCAARGPQGQVRCSSCDARPGRAGASCTTSRSACRRWIWVPAICCRLATSCAWIRSRPRSSASRSSWHPITQPSRHCLPKNGHPYRVPGVKRTLIAELPEKIGEQVTVRGWVQALRDQKRMQFIVIRDETGLAQVVLGKEDPAAELNEQVSTLTAESAVTVTGTVVADERVKLGGLELRLEAAAGRLARRAGASDRGGLRSGQADRLALSGPAPPGPQADLRGADDG